MQTTEASAAPAADVLFLRRFASDASATPDDLSLCTRRIVGGAREADIAVSLADSAQLIGGATTLVNQMYSWRGYGDDHRLTSGETCATFTVCLEKRVVGTLTLAVDSPEGLAADTTFKSELDVYRNAGVKLCELRTFAFNTDASSKYALGTLFHTIFIYEALRFGCTDVLIEVNPRHSRFYEAMLGFKRVGSAKIDPTVAWWPANLPVQLMRLNLADMKRQITNVGANQKRSLYPYFLSEAEARPVSSRIAALASAAHRPRQATAA